MTSTALRRFDLQLRTEDYAYRTPMKFGGRVVTEVTVLSADCDAESGMGAARGLGSMTMGVTWAWPSGSMTDGTPIDDGEKLSIVLELAERIKRAYLDADQTGHPLDICHRMNGTRSRIASELGRERGIAAGIPELAVLLAASPIEAALFDAHGKAAGQSSYALLSREHLANDLSHYLDDAYRGVHLSDCIAATPAETLPLYHLVGARSTDLGRRRPAGRRRITGNTWPVDQKRRFDSPEDQTCRRRFGLGCWPRCQRASGRQGVS